MTSIHVQRGSQAGPYQMCVRCVMDTSDSEIAFDDQGVCNHCRLFERVTRQQWFPNEEGALRWAHWVERIRAAGRRQEYDCIVGISGGVDSAYLAYRLKDSGLRILAVHVDGGWNSEIATSNIEMIATKLQIDLFTYVVDWEEMRDVQRAFLRSGVANQDVPQDHAFFAQLYRVAAQHRTRFFLSGGNIVTESILPRAWGYIAMDRRHLRAIHARFGERPLRTFPQVGFFEMYISQPYVRRLRVLRPLNFMRYHRDEAKEELSRALGWRDYGAKHHESRFTRFFQSYYLPVRFGYDKRRAHLSSQINAGVLTRDKALTELDQPPYDATTIEDDKRYIAKKLAFSLEEFQTLLDQPTKTYRDYPSNAWLFQQKDRAVAQLRSLASATRVRGRIV